MWKTVEKPATCPQSAESHNQKRGSKRGVQRARLIARWAIKSALPTADGSNQRFEAQRRQTLWQVKGRALAGLGGAQRNSARPN